MLLRKPAHRIMPVLKYGEINRTAARQIFGPLAVCCMRCAASTLRFKAKISRLYTRRLKKEHMLQFLNATLLNYGS